MPTPPNPDQPPYIAALDDLDPEATRAFVVAIGPTVLAAVRRVVGARHPDVEDIAQDAVIKLLEALQTFRGDCSIRHFACRIATNRALSARRHARYREVWTPTVEPETLESVSGSDAASMFDPYEAQRKRLVVRRLLDALPPAQAEALALYFIMGLTAEEVAETVGVPVGTVRSRIRLATQAIRQRIAEDGDDDLRLVLQGRAS